jgi:SAM-dependent methyltransferase
VIGAREDRVRTRMRGALGLQPLAENLSARLNGRLELSVDLLRSVEPRGKVLDVGCSTGFLEELTAADPGFRVIGLEVDPVKLAKARRFVPGAEFHEGSVLALPFAEASFDAATMFEVLEHIPPNSELQALREVCRTLKPGAAFILSTPFAHPLSCLLDPAWYVGHRHYGRMQLGGLLAEAGFEIDRCFVYGAFWDILTTDLFYVFKFAFGAEVPLHDLLEAQRRREFVGERAVEGISNIFVTAHKPSQLTGVARP